jgi:hypothetical protein
LRGAGIIVPSGMSSRGYESAAARADLERTRFDRTNGKNEHAWLLHPLSPVLNDARMTAVNIREWWEARGRAAQQNSERLAAAARDRGIAGVRSLQELPDDELIARAPARTSLSLPRHEMEMQRRLKDSIEELTKETSRARWWAFWGSVAIGALTLVLVALTIILALKA